jgi:hypothetical protein
MWVELHDAGRIQAARLENDSHARRYRLSDDAHRGSIREMKQYRDYEGISEILMRESSVSLARLTDKRLREQGERMDVKTVYLKDGDGLNVIVELEASAFDPGGQIVAVAQSYRVVANVYGPTLELVALSPEILTLAHLPENRPRS